MPLTFSLIQLPHGQGLALPLRGSIDSAGYDLMAAIIEPVILAPQERKLIPCGFQMSMPSGYEAQIRSRSGLALKHGIIVFNAPGTIDADYRGEIQIILMNFGEDSFVIERGMRIAQMVISRHESIIWDTVQTFDGLTIRGVQGFGSTGIQELI